MLLLIILGKKNLVRQPSFYSQYIFKLYAIKQKDTLIVLEQLQEIL